ncbi:unnamed protein product [Lampetra fluviatilis]
MRMRSRRHGAAIFSGVRRPCREEPCERGGEMSLSPPLGDSFDDEEGEDSRETPLRHRFPLLSSPFSR